MTKYRHLARRCAVAGLLAACAGGLLIDATADTRVVRLVLPNAPGSGVDAIARAAQAALAKAWGKTVVIDNQPGAGGVLGLQTLARAAPDGSTLSLVSNNVVILPSVLKSVPFDMPGDFTPIALVGSTPMVLVVNPGRVPAANGRDFIALLKSKPGQLYFGSGGNGTLPHVACELYLEAAGVSASHIPYKGIGALVTDLIGGHIDFATTALSSVQDQIKSGSLRAIGMLTLQRSPAAPDIPTLAEQGLTNFSVDAWIAVIGPKNMKAEAVKEAHGAVADAFSDPNVLDAMTRQGTVVQVSSPEQAQAMFRAELAKYATLVKTIRLKHE